MRDLNPCHQGVTGLVGPRTWTNSNPESIQLDSGAGRGLQSGTVTYLGAVGQEEAAIWQQRQLTHLHAHRHLRSWPVEKRLRLSTKYTSALQCSMTQTGKRLSQ